MEIVSHQLMNLPRLLISPEMIFTKHECTKSVPLILKLAVVLLADGEVSQRFALVNRFPSSKWEDARRFLLGS